MAKFLKCFEVVAYFGIIKHMLEKINTVKEVFKYQYLISKSKFIAYVYPFDEGDKVDTILTALKKEEKGATHYCYGFKYLKGLSKLKLEKDTNDFVTGYSDDGEPTGTAGMQILKAINEVSATNVLIIVVRYFGGIKLGVGGLGRAYKLAADEVLKNLSEFEIKNVIKMSLSYSNFEKLKATRGSEFVVDNVEYGEAVDAVICANQTLNLEKVMGDIDFEVLGKRYEK